MIPFLKKLPVKIYEYMDVDTFLKTALELNSALKPELIKKAFTFGDDAHKDQSRASGEKYFSHSINVALLLAGQQLDTTTICAGLLHDVVEDTEVSLSDVRANFGEETADLVDGVTRISSYQAKTSLETRAEYFRKMLLSMAKDIRVILIKLADRLHNMRTLDYLSNERQIKIARETFEVYAPIAHRMGMAIVKRELEDLSIKYLKADEYNYIESRLKETFAEREAYIREVLKPIEKELKKSGIEYTVLGRPKSIYSIHRKMVEKERSFEEIYDIFAIRLIVNSVQACYHALGIVHMMYVPIGGFDDYIAKPKQNGYQSIHTNVIGPKGHVVEIQIRTHEMNYLAEYGIASHWLYKEGRPGVDEADKRLNWLREVLDWQKDLTNPAEFLEYLKIDLYHDEVFIFTPKGELKHLPAGSTVLDFAFTVHTEVGQHCAGAKINGKLVPLATVLNSGDEVEILTSSNQQPSRDWLKMVRTSGARSKIRRFLKSQELQRHIQMGKEKFERRLKKLHLKAPSDKKLLECAKKFSLKTLDMFYAGIGRGDVSEITAINKLFPQTQKDEEEDSDALEEIITARTRSTGGIKIDDINSLQFNFGKCCQPVPGEKIVGFITRGRGITVHRIDCPNMLRANIDRERIVDLDWDVTEKSSFIVQINILMEDRKNILRDILNTIADDETNLKNAHTTASRGLARGEFIAEVKNLSHLNRIIEKIKLVKGVIDVSRRLGSSGSKK